MSSTLKELQKQKSIKDKLKLSLRKEKFLKDNLNISNSIIYFEKNVYIKKETLEKLYKTLKDTCKE